MWALARGPRPALAAGVAVAALVVALVVEPVAHASSATSVSFTFEKPDGSPLASADVWVYYWPFDPTSSMSLARMASGTTDGSGNWSGTLDTSMVQTADLAYSDTGEGAFNAIVVASDGQGDLSVQSEVLTLSGTSSDTVPSVQIPTGGAVADTAGTPSLDASLVGSTKRWIKVLTWNAAYGMSSHFYYEIYRATKTQVATSNCSDASWCIGGWMEEEDQGSASVTLPEPSTPTHDYTRAEYVFDEYKYDVCVIRPNYCYAVYQWDPHQWTGGLGDYSSYSPPPFSKRYADPYRVGTVLQRASGEYQQFGDSFSLEGLELQSEATFASSRWVRWAMVSGCGQTRWLWGADTYWTDAWVVQASCL